LPNTSDLPDYPERSEYEIKNLEKSEGITKHVKKILSPTYEILKIYK